MANPKRGEAPIRLGGKNLKLRYNFNALAELENITGIAVTELQNKGVGVRFIRDAISCGLRSQPGHRKMTPEVVGDLMDPDDIDHYAVAVTGALNSFFGSPEELQEKDLGEDEPEGQETETSPDGTGTGSSEKQASSD